uniref:FP protein C-terminal domain-containing protein n=1 Tax=Pectinophora gossypiella TaxID=13191 RepID=A0A1E1WQT7_PECGO
MPRVTRSPPQPSNSEIKQVQSEPDIPLATSGEDFENINITSRHKRPRVETSPKSELQDFKTEFKEMLTSWKLESEKNLLKIVEKQDSTTSKLMTDIAELKTQNSEIQKTNLDIEKSMSFISQQYEDMAKQINALQNERQELKNTIKNLQLQVQDLQFKSRPSSIEIRNVPNKDKETPADLLNVVSSVGSALKVKIGPENVRDIYRLPAKPGNRKTIIAELTSVQTKNLIISSVRNSIKNPNKDLRINTHLIGLPGDKEPIYIAEYLPGTTRRLYHLAREFSKRNDYKFCWTSNGNIFLRKDKDSTNAILVSCEKILIDLERERNIGPGILRQSEEQPAISTQKL